MRLSTSNLKEFSAYSSQPIVVAALALLAEDNTRLTVPTDQV
jgi:hypothetical protein